MADRESRIIIKTINFVKQKFINSPFFFLFMQKEEIIAGLKIAVEKGYSFEQAKRSFINAGYKQEDVEDSAAFLSSGVISMPSASEISKNYVPSNSFEIKASQQPYQQNRQYTQGWQNQQAKNSPQQNIQIQNQKVTRTGKLVIILAIILFLLLLFLFATIFFKKQVSEILNSLF